MSKWENLQASLLSNPPPANLRFEEVAAFLQRLGYQLQVRGSHHLFKQPGWPALNLQPLGGYVNDTK